MDQAALLDAYLGGPDRLRSAVTGLGREQMIARPVAGRWSVLEVVCHLVDTDAMTRADDPDRTSSLTFRYTAEVLSANGVTGCPSLATEARNGSSRVGSPGGAVAAIGSTGRIPYGRQSSRSNNTGPAATGSGTWSRRCTGSTSPPTPSAGR